MNDNEKVMDDRLRNAFMCERTKWLKTYGGALLSWLMVVDLCNIVAEYCVKFAHVFNPNACNYRRLKVTVHANHDNYAPSYAVTTQHPVGLTEETQVTF